MKRKLDYGAGGTTQTDQPHSQGNHMDLYRDILRREPLTFDERAQANYLAGNSVMIVGAGGSIGTEVARLVAAHGPSRLLLVDHSEFAMFQIGSDIAEAFPEVHFDSIIGTLRDREWCQWLIREHAPGVVINAAAIKHVGLAEANVCEAVLVNVEGAINLMHWLPPHVRFVQVSTDKAVEPVSVMGATKYLAEIIAQMHRRPIARLGNVFASSGSIGSIFDRQIAKGGPVTVTDTNMRRYFMTAEEAAGVVIESLMYRGAEVVVPNLTEQHRIVTIAERMIGARAMAITFTGAKAGEKLSETMVWPDEELHTRGDSVATYSHHWAGDLDTALAGIARLTDAARKRDAEATRSLLFAMVG